MDFSWTDEQLALRDDIIRFAQEELGDDVVARDHTGTFSWEGWQRCADYGILGLYLPEAYSGTPARDLVTTALAMEALGYGCRDNGLTFALNAQMWAIQMPLLRFGTDEQKERLLPALCRGKRIGAHGLTEPEAGSDVYSLQTRAEKRNGGYVLHGRKRYITLGPIADLAIVFANLAPERGKWGLTAFVVERGMDGFRAGPVWDKMGLRTVPFGELIFEDCFVPEGNRLGPEGAGWSISHSSVETERCFILSSQVGAMARQLDEAVAYAQQRRQFGQPVGKFQAVAHRLTEMRLRLETARLLLYKVAWLKAQGRPTTQESALLKLHLSESFVASGLDAIRTYGGGGYVTDWEVERDLRDAIGAILYAGTSDMQRNIIARTLGL